MVELQHLLGLLAPVDGMQPQTDPGDADDAPLHPQPGLGRLQALVDRVAAAGLPVRLTVTGQPRALPPGLDLTAYRVVQEALTNAMKHAGQAAAVVTLDYREDAVVVDVSDNGGRDRRPGRAASSVRTSPAGVAGSGRGLLGLRERLSLYGGDFDAGPKPSGGWRVTARLPDAPVARPVMTIPGPPSSLAQPYGQPSVVIADDQVLVRTGFRLILTEAGIPVVAEAADGGEAVERGAQAQARRRPHGYPDAGHGRARGDPADPGSTADQPVPHRHAHHLRPGPVHLRGAGGGGERLPAQARDAGIPRVGSPARALGRRAAVAVHYAPTGRAVCARRTRSTCRSTPTWPY